MDRALAKGENPDSPGFANGADREWFRTTFGAEYLRLYRHRDAAEGEAQAHFAREVTPIAASARVLDLACGAGRHARVLARDARVIGLDRSRGLLDEGRRASASTPAAERPRWVEGDMRHLPFARAGFDVVVTFFSSLGYFSTEEENRATRREISRTLKPGGRFFIDLMDRQWVIDRLVPQSERSDGTLSIRERRWITEGGERVEKETVVVDGSRERRYQESVRLYDIDDIRDRFAEVGLEVERTYGDFSGVPHRAGETPRMILTGVRTEVGSK